MALLISTASLMAALASWFVLRWGQSAGSPLPSPDERHRKSEDQFIPRIGGVAIAMGFAASLILGLAMVNETRDILVTWTPCLLTVGSMFLLGLWDDLRPLGAKAKLLGQLTIATGAYFMGLRVELLTGFSGDSIALHETIAFASTVGWLVALPNIVNLIDGIDGLAGGLGVFASITLAIVMAGSGQFVAGAIALCFAGATIGFLIFNFPPAKIYMGDGGAYTIGSVIATLSLQSSQKGSIAAIFLVVMIALGLPILDTTLAILRRSLRGVPLFRGDASHIHHRLLDLGHSTRRTVFFLYGLCLTLSLAGLVVFWTQGHALPIVAAALFIGSILLTRYLGMGTDLSNVRKQVAQASEWRSTVRRSHRLGEYLLSELPHCRDALEFWQLFDHAAERLGFIADARIPEATSVVSVQTKGNPALCLRYPEGLQGKHNRWGMADCLYPAFAAATQRWSHPEAVSAHKSETRGWKYSTMVVLSA